MILHSINVPFLILFSTEGHLGCFQFLLYMFIRYLCGRWSILSMLEWCSWILRQIDSHLPSGHHLSLAAALIFMHSYQQWTTVPLIPNRCQQKQPLDLLIWAILTGIRWKLKIVLICISPMARDEEHFHKCFLAICFSSMKNLLFRTVTTYFNWIICYLFWVL